MLHFDTLVSSEYINWKRTCLNFPFLFRKKDSELWDQLLCKWIYINSMAEQALQGALHWIQAAARGSAGISVGPSKLYRTEAGDTHHSDIWHWRRSDATWRLTWVSVTGEESAESDWVHYWAALTKVTQSFISKIQLILSQTVVPLFSHIL